MKLLLAALLMTASFPAFATTVCKPLSWNSSATVQAVLLDVKYVGAYSKTATLLIKLDDGESINFENLGVSDSEYSSAATYIGADDKGNVVTFQKNHRSVKTLLSDIILARKDKAVVTQALDCL